MVKDLDDLERDPTSIEDVRKWAEEIMDFVFTRSQEELVKNQSIDTGFLMRSGKRPIWQGNKLVIEYDAPYAMAVEYGQMPHVMSYKHLLRWVERKLRITGKKGVSISWAISKTIQQKGVNPRPFLRPAINETIIKYNLHVSPIDISNKPGQSLE